MVLQTVLQGALRYSIGYAGATVAVVALLSRSELLLFGLFLVGLLSLLFVVGASEFRVIGPVSPEMGHGPGQRTSITERTVLPFDRALLFYGVGLAVLAMATMVVGEPYLS